MSDLTVADALQVVCPETAVCARRASIHNSRLVIICAYFRHERW